MVFYCPQCGKTELDYKHDKLKFSFVNMRDGYGRPLHHTKCECGNYLAAYTFFTKEDIGQDVNLLDYIKYVITGYDRNGIYYSDGFYEDVEDRAKEYDRQQEENRIERNRVSQMSKEEKERYYEERYKELKARLETE